MRILTFLSLMIAVGSFGVGCDSVRAAAPVRVDVHTVTIKENRNSEATIHVYAVDDAGNDVTFGGFSNYLLSFSNDEPFAVPATVQRTPLTNFI